MLEPVGQPLTLDPKAQGVAAARRYVREQLERCHATDVEMSAELGVSELATNAVLHGRTPFTVAVLRNGDRVRIEVSDRSPLPPQVRRLSKFASTGRGLRLVASVSASWGIVPRRTEDGGGDGVGKTVWFEPLEEPSDTGFAEALLVDLETHAW
jgi:anti-sigma regulatory factor (Ser/Thr protein kinase)